MTKILDQIFKICFLIHIEPMLLSKLFFLFLVGLLCENIMLKFYFMLTKQLDFLQFLQKQHFYFPMTRFNVICSRITIEPIFQSKWYESGSLRTQNIEEMARKVSEIMFSRKISLQIKIDILNVVSLLVAVEAKKFLLIYEN